MCECGGVGGWVGVYCFVVGGGGVGYLCKVIVVVVFVYFICMLVVFGGYFGLGDCSRLVLLLGML